MAMLNGDVPRKGLTLSIIGCGVMGSAMLSRLLQSSRETQLSGAEPRIARFIACVNSEASKGKLKVTFADFADHLTILAKENVRGMRDADIVMLGCKPDKVEEVLGQDGVAAALEGKLLISALVGTPQEKIRNAIRCDSKWPNIHCVRAMMNIAAQFGESMTVIEDVPLPGDYPEITNWIFSQMGKVSSVAPNLFDVGGVLAGPCPVLLSVAIDGLLDGAVSQGMPRAEGRRILTQSLVGLAKLLENGNTPDMLREKFSSPRGTTIEGLMSLEEDRVRYAYSRAAIKATKRSQEM